MFIVNMKNHTCGYSSVWPWGELIPYLLFQFFYLKMSHSIECAAISFCLIISENLLAISESKLLLHHFFFLHQMSCSWLTLCGSSTAFSLWPISISKHGLFVYGHTAANVIRVVDISQGWAWVQCWRVLFPLGRCQIRTAEGWILHYLQFAGRFFLICMPCSTGKHAKRA